MVRTENQDAFAILESEAEGAFFVLCDGAGGLPGGKEAAQTAVKAISNAPEGEIVPATATLTDAIASAREIMLEQGCEGITTAIVAWATGDWLHFATLGDGALSVIWPDGMVSQHLTPHHLIDHPDNMLTAWLGRGCSAAPRVGSIQLEPGCTVLAMSDGASDLFPYDDFARHQHDLLADMRIKLGLANALLSQLEAARDELTGDYLHSDNMTLLVAHWPVAQADEQ